MMMETSETMQPSNNSGVGGHRANVHINTQSGAFPQQPHQPPLTKPKPFNAVSFALDSTNGDHSSSASSSSSSSTSSDSDRSLIQSTNAELATSTSASTATNPATITTNRSQSSHLEQPSNNSSIVDIVENDELIPSGQIPYFHRNSGSESLIIQRERDNRPASSRLAQSESLESDGTVVDNQEEMSKQTQAEEENENSIHNGNLHPPIQATHQAIRRPSRTDEEVVDSGNGQRKPGQRPPMAPPQIPQQIAAQAAAQASASSHWSKNVMSVDTLMSGK